MSQPNEHRWRQFTWLPEGVEVGFTSLRPPLRADYHWGRISFGDYSSWSLFCKPWTRVFWIRFYLVVGLHVPKGLHSAHITAQCDMTFFVKIMRKYFVFGFPLHIFKAITGYGVGSVHSVFQINAFYWYHLSITTDFWFWCCWILLWCTEGSVLYKWFIKLSATLDGTWIRT